MLFRLLPALCGAALFAIAAPALIAQPTANEQALIYEINRMRSDPQRYDTEQSLGGLLTGITPSQPLAVNDNLVSSSRWHSTDMATVPYYFGHQSTHTGEWPNKMARNFGYPLATSLPDTTNNIESLAGGSANVLAALKFLIEDAGTVPPGHRYHLLATGPSASFYAQFREIGTGYAFNASATFQRYYAIQTGFRDADSPWLTGVVYNDANSNGRYDEGEGLGGVTVGATGPATLNTTTNSQGGWSIAVTAGTWNLTCSGGAFSGSATAQAVVGTQNIEVDFASGRAAGEVAFAFQTAGGGRVVNISTNSLGFTSPSIGVASANQTYTVSGLRLTVGVTLTAPTQFELSLNGTSGWAGAQNLAAPGGTLAATTIYVRHVPTGATTSGAITNTSTNAMTATVNVTGAVVTTPVIFVAPSTLNIAANQLGQASPEQNYSLSAYNLTGNLAITAPAQFEVSQTSGSGFAASLNIAHVGGTVSPRTIYVRFVPTALTGSGSISNAGGGATTQFITLNGTVTNAPLITAAPASLSCVAPTLGTPSAEQTCTISGQYLGGNIVITLPANFEMTLTSGSGYVTSLNLTPVSGTVAATTVYVRFTGAVASSSGNLACNSTLATTKQISLSGTVAPPPVITVSLTSLALTSPALITSGPSRQFNVSGVNLTGNIVITAPASFEVSLNSATGFGPSLSLTPSGGTVSTTAIFARYTPVVLGVVNGDITHVSSGATTRIVSLTGTISSGGSGSSGSADSGGGCSAGGQAAPWLLLAALMLLAGMRLRRAQ
jgi:uncharacterized protein YkwD